MMSPTETRIVWVERFVISLNEYLGGKRFGGEKLTKRGFAVRFATSVAKKMMTMEKKPNLG